MNCKNVEELFPLYVGRDLEERRAGQVTAHVQTCTECAGAIQEYGEAHQLLQGFEPPQFSEATLAAVRGNVLREIERKSNARGLIGFFTRPLPLHMTWAVTAAVMVVVGVFAYYFLADRMSQQGHRQPLTANAGVPEDHSAAISKPDPTGTAGGRGPRPGSPAGVLDPPAPATPSPNSRLNLTSHIEIVGVPPAPGSRRSRLNQTMRHSTQAGGTPAVPVKAGQIAAAEPNDTSSNTSATSDKTLRLEIQTSDPNIRIIWFSHKPINEGSPSESSKGI